MPSSQGALAKFARDTVSPIDTSSTGMELVSFGITETVEHLQTNGIRGTRSLSKERNREGLKRVGGPITWHPSPLDLDFFLPCILGAAENADAFAVDEALTSFVMGVDLVADAFEYGDLFVNKATFRGAAGQLVELTLDCIGEAKTDLSYPSLTLGVAAGDVPYRFFEGVLTLESSAREMESFELTIDNQLATLFRNSQTATAISPQNRIVMLTVETPYTSSEVGLNTAAFAGAAGSLVFTNGNMSTTFTFGNLQLNPKTTPVVNGKSEIVQRLTYQAFRSGSTREIAVTSDSTA